MISRPARPSAGRRWQKIAGLRDVLIHAYFGVDLDIVWQVASEKVPELERRVSELLDAG